MAKTRRRAVIERADPHRMVVVSEDTTTNPPGVLIETRFSLDPKLNESLMLEPAEYMALRVALRKFDKRMGYT